MNWILPCIGHRKNQVQESTVIGVTGVMEMNMYMKDFHENMV